jgi:uncharacterized protein YrzB (UPF0473 family)
MTEHTHDHEHDHDHEHEVEVETISLVDENDNEALYEVVLRIDGGEEFDNKNYILLTEAGLPDDEEAEVYAYSYVENEDGTEGDLQPVESDKEWDMIEETFNALVDEEE